jgi:type II secretory pathway component PulC
VYKTLFHCSLCIIFALTSTALFAVTSFTLPDGEVLQDPTKPQLWRVPTQIGSQQKESSFTLNYIVASGQEKRAMINGHKVVVGDVVAGAKVKQINSDSVYLIYQGKQKELRMNQVKGIKRN